jgi:hypothetical protein
LAWSRFLPLSRMPRSTADSSALPRHFLLAQRSGRSCTASGSSSLATASRVLASRPGRAAAVLSVVTRESRR